MTLGEFDTNHDGLGLVVVVLSMILECIIFLNLLIAVMGDTFDRVQDNYELFEYRILCSLMLEVETLLSWKRDMGSPLYVHLCRYVY